MSKGREPRPMKGWRAQPPNDAGEDHYALVAEDEETSQEVIPNEEKSETFFLKGRLWTVEWVSKDVTEKLWLLGEHPHSPSNVQQAAYLLRALKRLRPLAVTDANGESNPIDQPHAEWLGLIRQLDNEMAEKTRRYIERQGEQDYLNCCLAQQEAC